MASTVPPLTNPSDPHGWSSKPDELHTTELWGKGSWSWLEFLQSTFGIEAAKPLLTNSKEALMYVISGTLAKRDLHNRIAIGLPGKDGFFLFNATTCEVRLITAPERMDEIWESLGNEGEGMKKEDILPVARKDETEEVGSVEEEIKG